MEEVARCLLRKRQGQLPISSTGSLSCRKSHPRYIDFDARASPI
ncbi:hypothetical protein CCUS01_13729 [Colletotrichum cuscutae]|uniref:Uncharacterized protein n=1 Tax=Colletotrichum cuscutae TaxID=1209917 RepID=A0AAI9YB60_9PEZI|nr:hypothetical protein CCUS01_13729 [Colletotrichum cuscutae]